MEYSKEIDERIAGRLRALRAEREWTLDDLAQRSGVSRATLSRVENGSVSPTAALLGKLCAAYAITLSRLMVLAETEFDAFVPEANQPVWQDPESGLVRRAVSPPAETLAGEVLVCTLPAGARIDYPAPPRPGLEHHLYLLDGALEMTIEKQTYRLRAGDCLRYRLFGASRFETAPETGAEYVLAMV